MSKVYCELVAVCYNAKTDERKSITAPAVFATEEDYDIFNGGVLDHVDIPFNDWLESNGYKGWFVDDVIEVGKTLNKKDMPDKGFVYIDKQTYIDCYE